MKTGLVVAAAASVLFAGFAAVSPALASRPVGQVTGAALRNLVTDMEMHTTNGNGHPFTLIFHRGGKLGGSSQSQNYGGGTLWVSGTWWIRGPDVCVDSMWGNWQAPQTCRSFRWDGKHYIESANGHVATFTPLPPQKKN